MNFEWEPEYTEFRDELRAFIADWRTPELLQEYAETYGGGGERIRAFHDAIDERGWMRMCWAPEVGGEGRSMLYHYIFVEEMEYWGMPYGNLTFTSIAPSARRPSASDAAEARLPARASIRGELHSSRSATASPTRAPTWRRCAPAPNGTATSG